MLLLWHNENKIELTLKHLDNVPPILLISKTLNKTVSVWVNERVYVCVTVVSDVFIARSQDIQMGHKCG